MSLLMGGGLCVAASVAAGVPALVEHAELRGAWERARGTDAERSDRLYDASREAHQQAGVGGLLGAFGALCLLMGWRRIQPARDLGTPRDDLRVWLATAVDGAGFMLLGSLAFLDDGESGSLHALACAGPVLAFLPVAALPWGRSLGLELTRLRCSPSARGILAALLLPLGLLCLPFGLVFRGARTLHLRLAGMHVVAGGAGC